MASPYYLPVFYQCIHAGLVTVLWGGEVGLREGFLYRLPREGGAKGKNGTRKQKKTLKETEKR